MALRLQWNRIGWAMRVVQITAVLSVSSGLHFAGYPAIGFVVLAIAFINVGFQLGPIYLDDALKFDKHHD